jgi:hypothetical protein
VVVPPPLMCRVVEHGASRGDGDKHLVRVKEGKRRMYEGIQNKKI